MLIDPDISKEEFQGIVGAVTMLQDLLKKVQYLSVTQIASELRDGVGALEASGISRVTALNDAAMEARDHYYSEVAQRQNFTVSWAVYDVLPNGMGASPYCLASKLVYIDDAGNQFGPVELEEWSSWLRLWRAADALIIQSEDAHEKTIVGFDVDGTLLKVRVTA